MRLARRDVRDYIKDNKTGRWRSYRFYKALQRLKSPTYIICEIFEAPRFASFSKPRDLRVFQHNRSKAALTARKSDFSFPPKADSTRTSRHV